MIQTNHAMQLGIQPCPGATFMTYYDVDFGGVIHEIQAPTKEAAVEWAEERLADICFRNGIRKETMPITLIQYNDDGDEVSRLDIKIGYEYYHGDNVEHGTY